MEDQIKPRARHLLWSAGIAIAAGSAGCAMDAGEPAGTATATFAITGAPTASLTHIRPVVGGAVVYEPLPPRHANAAEDAQLLIDVVVRNDQGSSINVDRVRLSYAGPVVPASVNLEAGVRKMCTGEDVFDLVDDRTLTAGQSCRLILGPDQKLPAPGPNQVTVAVYFVGYTDPVSVTMPLAAHQNAPAEGSYRFPARAEDLPAGQYWSAQSSGAGSHHRTSTSSFYAYDAGLVRWDTSTSDWSNLHPGRIGDSNDDYLVWEQPIYAMADGVVLAFDNDEDDNVPGVESSNANYFAIQHGDEIGKYYHLKKSSLNPALLSVNAPVTKGQFLGLVGNSGHTDFPHLHVQVERSGVGMPLLFHEMFLIDRVTLGTPPSFDAPFTAVDDQGLPWQKNIIWPSPFLRKDDGTDVSISDVAIAAASGNLAVTAARSAAGNLALVTWELNSDGNITRKQDDSGGPATEIAITQPGFSSNVVTAFRDSGGDLELVSWDVVAGTGALDRIGEHSAGPVSKIAMSRLPNAVGVVTAFRDGGGDLGLIAWETPSGGGITRHGDATAEAITDVAIATINDPFDGVVTAARNSAGNLVLTTWEVTAAKQLIRRDDASAGAISKLAMSAVRVAFNKELIVTAVRDGNNNLKLLAWEITSTGQIIPRGDVTGGAITDVAIAADGSHQLVTAVRDSGGNLKLIAWEVSLTGTFEREGEIAAGAATHVALTSSFTSSGRKFALPALRDSAGDLRLISVQTNLTP